jgi:cyclic beta-1,2-glucan synthetase
MDSLERRLVKRETGIVQLFSPPFDRTPLDPGYIKGYGPGIRENGGQYTHAAVGSVVAFALLGDGDKAADLFSLLNPIHHTSDQADLDRYKVEPYAIAADVYSAPPHPRLPSESFWSDWADTWMPWVGRGWNRR